MQIFDINKLIQAAPTQEPLMPVLDAGKARVLVLNLAAGQAVDPCEMPFLILYYFIEGQGTIRVGPEKKSYHPHTLTSVPAEATRRIAAERPTRVLMVQIP